MTDSQVQLLLARRAAVRDLLHLPQRPVGGGGSAGRGAPCVPDDAGDARLGRVLSRPPARVPASPARPPARRLQLHRPATAPLARRRKQLGAAPARPRPPPPRRAAQERATELDARLAHQLAHAGRVPRHFHFEDGARDPHRRQEPDRGRQASDGGVEGGGRHSLPARAAHAVFVGRPLAAAPLRAWPPQAALRTRAARGPHLFRPAAAQRHPADALAAPPHDVGHACGGVARRRALAP
mmetsp:Transcript_44372/g.144029  ORF Transcript_44372/g.144029 Transcript_44372/m.144029 type:complete len:239 (+) Transcript_44372:1452-2168(+)